jgi:pyruvate-formate lyase-activating enzyme
MKQQHGVESAASFCGSDCDCACDGPVPRRVFSSRRDESCFVSPDCDCNPDVSDCGGGQDCDCEAFPTLVRDRCLSSTREEDRIDGDCIGACDIDIDGGGGVYPGRSLPGKYYLLLTPRCDHRCAGCSNAFFSDYRARQLQPDHDTVSLSAEQWASIIDRLASHAELFIITGGEPTLHPGFRSILERLESWRVSYTVFTNGNWESSQGLVSFLSQLRYLRGLLISLHASDAASHDRFSGRVGSFDRVVANIRLAVAAGLRVRVSTVVTRYNAGQTDRVVALAASLGATGVAFNRSWSHLSSISPWKSCLPGMSFWVPLSVLTRPARQPPASPFGSYMAGPDCRSALSPLP